MTTLSTLIWDVASHPIVHRPAHQAIGLGSFLVRHGFGLLQSTLKEGTPQSRILKGSVGSTLLGAGGYLISQGGAYFGSSSIHQIASLFFSPQNTREAREGLHPNEDDVETFLGKSYLHLNQSDSRPKFLWLTADYDHNGALKVSIGRIGGLESLLDFKYQIIDHPEELCNAIQSAVKTGNLQTIVLDAHGSPSSIALSPQKLISVLQSLSPGCFKGVPRNAKFFLKSCFGGSDLVLLNIAEWLAAESGLPVYASKDYVSDDTTIMSFPNQKEIEIDFCNEAEFFDTDVSPYYKCKESATRVFHPPVTLFEKSVFTAKMGLSALLGLFIAYELTRIPLTALSLTYALMSKVGENLI
jgi:hypothetical protein